MKTIWIWEKILLSEGEVSLWSPAPVVHKTGAQGKEVVTVDTHAQSVIHLMMTI